MWGGREQVAPTPTHQKTMRAPTWIIRGSYVLVDFPKLESFRLASMPCRFTLFSTLKNSNRN